MSDIWNAGQEKTADGTKQDRRIRYTKMVLRQSLLELMKQKKINAISVKDICELADINRGTFYSHYSDPFDLLAQIEKELYDKVEEALSKQEEAGMKIDTYQTVLEIMQCIEQYSDVCKILVGQNGDTLFINHISQIARDRFVKQYASIDLPHKEEQMQFIYTFIAHGSVGIIQQWLLDGMRQSAQEIAQIVSQMARGGLKEFWENL